jgi:hypothetical protein
MADQIESKDGAARWAFAVKLTGESMEPMTGTGAAGAVRLTAWTCSSAALAAVAEYGDARTLQGLAVDVFLRIQLHLRHSSWPASEAGWHA